MKVLVKVINDFKTDEYVKDFMELAHFLNIRTQQQMDQLLDSENKDIVFVRRGNDSNAIIRYKFIKEDKYDR